ncbi:hypothetical protein CCUS01_13287 [Colletotrichum cuscutae]|uniref:Uncharacterized protein n=1 Tax=Colletotrichum cuscutae TaxID=1209917 RepID=A0AAI9YCN5_9PEZI|nr:hypothetical protein CCUS01_13287 [Colletotrichum cuscutae]
MYNACLYMSASAGTCNAQLEEHEVPRCCSSVSWTESQRRRRIGRPHWVEYPKARDTHHYCTYKVLRPQHQRDAVPPLGFNGRAQSGMDPPPPLPPQKHVAVAIFDTLNACPTHPHHTPCGPAPFLCSGRRSPRNARLFAARRGWIGGRLNTRPIQQSPFIPFIRIPFFVLCRSGYHVSGRLRAPVPIGVFYTAEMLKQYGGPEDLYLEECKYTSRKRVFARVWHPRCAASLLWSRARGEKCHQSTWEKSLMPQFIPKEFWTFTALRQIRSVSSSVSSIMEPLDKVFFFSQ